jgi:hypothetical protein
MLHQTTANGNLFVDSIFFLVSRGSSNLEPEEFHLQDETANSTTMDSETAVLEKAGFLYIGPNTLNGFPTLYIIMNR